MQCAIMLLGLPEHGDDAKLTQLYSRSEDYDITEAAVLSAYLRTTQEVSEYLYLVQVRF